MSEPIEYRVSWEREGVPRKVRRYVRLGSAQRFIRLLTVDSDPHYRCDEGHGYFTGSGYGSGYDRDGNEWVSTCLPDLIEPPSLEQRTVGPWLAARPLTAEEGA